MASQSSSPSSSPDSVKLGEAGDRLAVIARRLRPFVVGVSEEGLGDARGVFREEEGPVVALRGWRREEDEEGVCCGCLGLGLGSTAWRTVRTSVFTLNLDFWLNILIFE